MKSTNEKAPFNPFLGHPPMRTRRLGQLTNENAQVASEMLPNSTERAVTVSGGSEALTQCIYNICTIMAEVKF
jgi:hypothetical protein